MTKAKDYPFSRLEIEISKGGMRVVGYWASLEKRNEYGSGGASYEMQTLLLDDDDPLDVLRRLFNTYLPPVMRFGTPTGGSE